MSNFRGLIFVAVLSMGLVFGTVGQPIGSVGVGLGRKPKPSANMIPVTTNGNGTFQVNVPEAGTYQLVVLGGAGLQNLTAGTPIQLTLTTPATSTVRPILHGQAQSPRPQASFNSSSRPGVKAIAVVDDVGGLAFNDTYDFSGPVTVYGHLQVHQPLVSTDRLSLQAYAAGPPPPGKTIYLSAPDSWGGYSYSAARQLSWLQSPIQKIQITNALGTVNPGDPLPALTVSVGDTGVPPGIYTDVLQVTFTPADGSAPVVQNVVVTTRIAPPNQTLGVQLSQTEVALPALTSAPVDSSTPRLTTVAINVTNLTATVENYVLQPELPQNTGLFSSPNAGFSVAPGQTLSVPLTVDRDALAQTGAMRTCLLVLRGDGESAPFCLVRGPVQDATADLAPLYAQQACQPSQLLPIIKSGPRILLEGVPASYEIAALDDCGTPVTDFVAVLDPGPQDELAILRSTSNIKQNIVEEGRTHLKGVKPQPSTATGVDTTTGAAAVLVAVPSSGTAGPLDLRFIVTSGNLSGSTTLRVQVVASPQLPTTNAQPVGTNGKLTLPPNGTVTLTGANLATDTLTASSDPGVPLPTKLGGASVLVDGVPTSLLSVAPGALTALLPLNITPGNHVLWVSTSGGISAPQTVTVSAAAPRLLSWQTGSGATATAAKVQSDGTLIPVDAGSPASPGDTLQLAVDGLGLLQADGTVAAPVSVTIGGQPAAVVAAALKQPCPPATGCPVGPFGTNIPTYSLTVTVPTGLQSADPTIGMVDVQVQAAGVTSDPVAVNAASTQASLSNYRTVALPLGKVSYTVDGATASGWLASTDAVGANHTLSVSPTQTYKSTKYAVDSWNVTDPAGYNFAPPVGSTTYGFTIPPLPPSQAVSIAVNFVPADSLTLSASPAACGTVTATPGDLGGGFYPDGPITVSLAINKGWTFLGWSGANAAGQLTLAGPATVTALCKQTPATVNLTFATAPVPLSISVNGKSAVGGTSAPFVPGQSVALDVLADPQTSAAVGTRYRFYSWSQGGAKSQSLTVPSSAAVYTAYFSTEQKLTIVGTASMNPPSADGFYAKSVLGVGQTVTITGSCPAGQKVTGYSVDFGGGTVVNVTGLIATVVMNNPVSVTVVCSASANPVPISVLTLPLGLKVQIDGAAAQTTPATATWTPSSIGHTLAVTTPQADATGTTYYGFTNWTPAGPNTATWSLAAAPAAPTIYTANFAPACYILTVATPLGGTVTANPASGGVTGAPANCYAPGKVVTLTATPAPGFAFQSWSGSTTTGVLTMNAAASVTANFGPAITACIAPPSGMVAWYPLDEKQSPSADVSTGGANSKATWFGNPTSVPGLVGNAVAFAGNSQYIDAINPGEADVTTGDLSIDVWVKVAPGSSGVQTLVDKRVVSSIVRGYALFLYNGNVGFQLADASGYSNWISAGPRVDDGAWHLVAATVSRGSKTGVKLWDNGTLVGTFDPTAYTQSLTNTGLLRIGGGQDYGFTGSLDEVEIFNRELSQADIQAIYNAKSLGKCKPASATVAVTVTTAPPALKVQVDGGSAQTAPASVTWTLGSTGHNLAVTTPQADAAGTTYYAFSGWSPSGPTTATWPVGNAPATATTYTANFSVACYVLTIAPVTGGTVTANPASGGVTGAPANCYAPGKVVTLTATPASGSVFQSWSGSTTTGVVTVNAPASVTAKFGPVPTACLTPPSGMVAWYPLDEKQSPSSDIATDGAKSSAKWFGSPASVAGIVGGAVAFAGNSQYMDAASAAEADITTGDLSVDVWVKVAPGSSGVQTLVDKRVVSSIVRGYALFLYNGTVGFQLADASGYSNWISAGPRVDDGAWHLVAATVSRGSKTGVKLWDNGTLVGTYDPTAYAQSLTNTGLLRIGGGQDFGFTGSLDEVEIFNRELSQAEIQAIYNAKSLGKCKPATTGPSLATYNTAGSTLSCNGVAGCTQQTATQVVIGGLTLTYNTGAGNGISPPSTINFGNLVSSGSGVTKDVSLNGLLLTINVNSTPPGASGSLPNGLISGVMSSTSSSATLQFTPNNTNTGLPQVTITGAGASLTYQILNTSIAMPAPNGGNPLGQATIQGKVSTP